LEDRSTVDGRERKKVTKEGEERRQIKREE
jgi:hypothetical protein